MEQIIGRWWLPMALAMGLTAAPMWLLSAVEGGGKSGVIVLKEGDLKVRMKSLISEALKAGDLWTAIQADAFATSKLGVRSSGLLGASEIIGDPLFAFPHMISSYHQRGETLVVVAGPRVYRLGLDGHPLAVSLPLSFTPDAGALSHDGKYLALIDRQTVPVRQLKVSVITLPSGTEVFNATVPLVAGDSIHGEPHIAEDGSAVVVALIDGEDEVVRLQVLRGSGKSVAVPGFYKPLGVGAGGAWALAEPLSNREADERIWMLLAAGKATPLLNGAAGPGFAAVITQAAPTEVQIVLADGSLAPLPLGMPLESKARVASVGDYLVLSTGWPSSKEEVDLLGNPIAVVSTPTTMLFRWSDLAQPATAKAALSLPGVFGPSRLTPNLVFVGAGPQLSTVDLTQATLAAKPLMTAPREIRAIDAVAGRLMMWLSHEERLVASEDGHVLWHGPAASATLHDPWYLEVRGEGQVVDWVHVAEKPEDRQVTRLKLLNPGTYDIELDRYHRRLLAVASRRDWHEFDPLTGKPVGDPLRGDLRPRLALVSPHEGGVMISQAARLVPRMLPPEDESTLRWNPLDAWRVGPALVVLDHHGQVYVSGRKRGTYPVIGSVDHAEGMGQITGGEVVMVGDELRVLAGLAAGPTLVVSGALIGTTAEPLPEGPWRIKNFFYIPPRGGSLVWDAAHCGFTPTRLRSPATGGMLAVTDSLVFDIDPALGKQLGVIDKAGLRGADE